MNSAVLTILSLSLSGSVMALLLLAAKPLFRRNVSKAFSYYIWVLVLLRLALPLAGPVNFMETIFSAPTQAEIIVPVNNPPHAPETVNGPKGAGTYPEITAPQDPAKTNAATDEVKPAGKVFDPWAFVKGHLLWIWAMGVGVSLAYFLTGYIRFARQIHKTNEPLSQEDYAVFLELCKGGRVEIAANPFVQTPILTGVIHPRIVVPRLDYVQNGMKAELSNIIRHELTHHRRADLTVKWATVLVTSLHWFNPLMILIRREISRACELSCDEAVIRAMTIPERQAYGDTLLDLAASERLPAGILTTTLSEDTSRLKERLISIIQYKKKPAWAAALTLILSILLTGCAAALGVVHGAAGPAVIQGSLPSPDRDGAHQGESGASDLRALRTKDLYENGRMFEDVAADFIRSFPDTVAAMAIPDARKGERAADIREGYESWGDNPLILLDAIPEQGVYLYGYNDAEYPGCGLILDIGPEQHIYAFPYRYMANTMLAPDVSANGDGSEVYVSCHTGGGTGVSVSELYVFQIGGDQVEPYYLDINDLADRLGSEIAMSYDEKNNTAAVYAGGRQIMADSPAAFIGAADSGNIIPDSYYCGNQITYTLGTGTVNVSWTPTLYTQEQPGAQGYLADLVSINADIRFTHDGDGTITGFDLGEVTAEGTAPQASHGAADFDGDGIADTVRVESADTGTEDAHVTLTVALGNGQTMEKRIDGNWQWDAPAADDLDGDGRDDIALHLIYYGSNYNGGLVRVFRAADGELTEFPSGLIKNNSLDRGEQAYIGDDFAKEGVEGADFIGATIVSRDGGSLLRLKSLIDVHADTAWYVDTAWTGTGWHIEDMNVGKAYGPDELTDPEQPELDTDYELPTVHRAGFREADLTFITELMHETHLNGGSGTDYLNYADGKDPDTVYYDSGRNMNTIPLRQLAQTALRNLYDMTGVQIDESYVISTGYGQLCFMESPDGYDTEVFFSASVDDCTGTIGQIQIAYRQGDAEFSPIDPAAIVKPEGYADMSPEAMAAWYYENSTFGDRRAVARTEGELGNVRLYLADGDFYEVFSGSYTVDGVECTLPCAYYGPYEAGFTH